MFLGMLRIKDEARWIRRVIRSIQPLCERIFVFDDHSTDGTPEICEELGCTVYRSHFPETTNETRDKNWLLRQVWKEVNPLQRGPGSQHWILSIDGDEEMEPGGLEIIRRSTVDPSTHALVTRIVYLWDSEDQIRTDGIYGRFKRASAFRMVSPIHAFGDPRKRDRAQSNFHCGSVPWELMSQAKDCGARLLHYGYLHREDRIRKYEWYNAKDPKNKVEDEYRHVVQGDVPEIPSNRKLVHAGPLTLESLKVCAPAA